MDRLTEAVGAYGGGTGSGLDCTGGGGDGRPPERTGAGAAGSLEGRGVCPFVTLGVGVCQKPGVRNTCLKTLSFWKETLCWKTPF